MKNKITENLHNRKIRLNKKFEFSEENIAKIKRVNSILLRKSHELFDRLCKGKCWLNHLTNISVIEGNYSLGGAIKINFPPEVAEHQTPYMISGDPDPRNPTDRISTLLEDENWDIEVFEPLKKYSIHICYATHWFFCDGLFALQDMIKLKEKNIEFQMEKLLIE